MIRFLIWDVDGTLLYTYPAINRAMLAALRALQRSANCRTVDQLCKISFGHCVNTLASQLGLDAPKLLEQFHLELAAVPESQQAPFPGVLELCHAAIEAGGANFILTHRQRSDLSALLESNHLTQLFTDSVAGDDGFPRKPDPTGLLDLVRRNALDPAQALVIGDRELDIVAAHRAGVRACLYGTNPCAEPPDFVVTDFLDFLHTITLENAATISAQTASGSTTQPRRNYD